TGALRPDGGARARSGEAVGPHGGNRPHQRVVQPNPQRRLGPASAALGGAGGGCGERRSGRDGWSTPRGDLTAACRSLLRRSLRHGGPLQPGSTNRNAWHSVGCHVTIHYYATQI